MARVYGRGVRWELGWEGSARGRHGDGVQGGLDGASLPLVCLFHLQRMSLGAATSGDQGRGTRRLGAR